MLQFPSQAKKAHCVRCVTPLQLGSGRAIRSLPGDPKQQGAEEEGNKKGFFLFHRSINELSVLVPKQQFPGYNGFNSNFPRSTKTDEGTLPLSDTYINTAGTFTVPLPAP